jgi:hypothetical protein
MTSSLGEVVQFRRRNWRSSPAADASVADLVGEYFALIAFMNRNSDAAANDEAFEAEEAVVARVIDMVAPTAAGILAQIRLLCDCMESGSCQWSDDRDKRLLTSIAAGVERLARRVAPG